MFKSNLGEYKNGWLLGNFSPAVIQTSDFEVCVKTFRVGDRETSHYQVIATDDELNELAKSYQYALITVGQVKNANHRLRLYQMSLKCGFKMPSIISPISHVSQNATIGEGSIVMHGAIINAGAQVGINCIINTRAVIEHDTSVGDHCHISTGAILNGGVSVGTGCFIGSGTVMKEGISTGKDCVVGMGLSVRHNLTDKICFTGHQKS